MKQPTLVGSLSNDVTVVIPALNREALLPRALKSVQAQTLAAVDIIVVDDCSTDDTAAVARELGARVVSMATRSGSGPARNAGIAAAQTSWIAFLDSDDEWTPTHLEDLSAHTNGYVLLTAPGVSSGGRLIGNVSPRSVQLDPVQLLVPGDTIVTSGTVVRADVLGAVGGFSALPRAQDLDLWLRVLEQGPGLATSVPSVRYHEHLTQASRDSELMREAFDSILNRYSDRPWLTSRVRSAAYGRVVWDDFRAAQRAREWPQAASRAFWLASHPPAWRAVALLLRQRRFGRDRGAAAKAAIGWPD